jgi:hypothetical protein
MITFISLKRFILFLWSFLSSYKFLSWKLCVHHGNTDCMAIMFYNTDKSHILNLFFEELPHCIAALYCLIHFSVDSLYWISIQDFKQSGLMEKLHVASTHNWQTTRILTVCAKLWHANRGGARVVLLVSCKTTAHLQLPCVWCGQEAVLSILCSHIILVNYI